MSSKRPRVNEVDPLYTAAEVARKLKLTAEQFAELRRTKEEVWPDVIVPGPTFNAGRWTAARVAKIEQNRASVSAPDAARGDT